MIKRGLIIVIILLSILIMPVSYSPTITNICQTLNTAGTTYELNTSLSTNVNCFTFNASNVVLDCQGFNVNSTIATATGVSATLFSNITVKGCNIFGFSRAITFSGVNDSEVSNNTLRGGIFGVTITNSNFNNISFNNIYNFTDIGMWINGANSNHNVLRNNTVHNQSNNAAFLIFGARNTTLTNNVAYNAPGGFFFSESNNSNISNSIAYNLTGTGFYLANTTVNMSLFNLTSYNNTRYGIHINATSDNNISFSNISNNSLGGIYIERGSSGNRIFSNTIYNHTSPAILLELVNAVNRVYSNLFIENNTYGIYLNSTNLTNITDNMLKFNTDTAVFLNLSYNNNVTNNTANNNSLFNFVVFLGADNNLSYNTANNSNTGFNLTLTNNNLINFNNATNNRNYGFYFTNSTGNNLSMNNATNPNVLSQYFFTSSNATLNGINFALNTLRTSVDLNITSNSNVTTRNSDSTFNNFTTDYGTIFFHGATNVSLKLMNRTDSGAAASGCSGFGGTCTLITAGNNVVNITNTSAAAVINLGMYYDPGAGASSSNLYVARYAGSGWSRLGQTSVDTTLSTVRYDNITSFSTFAVVNFVAAAQTDNVAQEKGKDTSERTTTTTTTEQTPPPPPAPPLPAPEIPRQETPPQKEEPVKETEVPALTLVGDFPISLEPLPQTIDVEVQPQITREEIIAARQEFEAAEEGEERTIIFTQVAKEADEKGTGGSARVEYNIVKREISKGVTANMPKLDVRLKIKGLDQSTLKKLKPVDVGLRNIPAYAVLVIPLSLLFLMLSASKNINIITRKKSKKGQIFLIASIIFVLALYSVAIPYNTIKTYPALENYKDLSSNYQTEFPKVFNWALFQGLSIDQSLDKFNTAFIEQARKTDSNFGAFYMFKDSQGNLHIVNTLNNKVMNIKYTDISADQVVLKLLSNNAPANGELCVEGQECAIGNIGVGSFDTAFYKTELKSTQKINELGIQVGDSINIQKLDITKFTGMAFLTSKEETPLDGSPDQVSVSVAQY